MSKQATLIGLYHPLDGVTNPKYRLLCFLTTKFLCKEKKALAFNQDRCCHLVLCLWLIVFHYLSIIFTFASIIITLSLNVNVKRQGARYISAKNLEVVWAEFSTLS
jgi:hypothetical protein